MRLNIRLIGLIHGLIVLSLVGYYLMRLISEGTNRSSRSSQSSQYSTRVIQWIALT